MATKRPSATRSPRRAGESAPVQQAAEQPSTVTDLPAVAGATSDAMAALLLDALRKASSGMSTGHACCPDPNPLPQGPTLVAINKFVDVTTLLATLSDPAEVRRPL